MRGFITMNTINFPDCVVYAMPQRSPEWHEIRRGKLTASEAGAWLAERPEVRVTVDELRGVLDMNQVPYKKSASKAELLAMVPPSCLPAPTLTATADKARKAAVAKCLGAISRCEVPDPFEVDPGGPPPRNPAMWAVWNGIRLEPEAIAAFEDATGHEVETVGFCLHKSKVVGCSPDGLIRGESVGLECKCPLPSTHVRWFLEGQLPDEHRDQVHFSMAVTGARSWWFQSYSPGLPTFRVRVDRDAYTEAMTEGIREFADALSKSRAIMAAAWDFELGNAEPIQPESKP